MPVPPLKDLITPTSTGASLPTQTVNHRLLLTLAMLATGIAPDGTTLPAGAAATPPVAGYAAWWDASQITGQSDNTALAAWPDLSGNGHTLTQTGSGGSTYYKTTPPKLVNGKPAVWFDGVNSIMSSASFGFAQPLTIFAVGGPGNVSTFLVDSSNRIIVGVHSNGNWALFAGGPYLDGSPAPVNQSVHVQAGVFNSPTSLLFVDGTQQAAGDCGAAALGILYMGGSTITFGGGLIGPVAEVLVYPSALSGPQITSTSTYLKTKWGTP